MYSSSAATPRVPSGEIGDGMSTDTVDPAHPPPSASSIEPAPLDPGTGLPPAQLTATEWGPSPTTLDLTPLLYRLHALTCLPPYGSTWLQCIDEVAHQIARSARIHIPADDAFRRLALETRPLMDQLLSAATLKDLRPPGMQAALQQFHEAWTGWLTTPTRPTQPLTLHKAVPLEAPLILSYGVVLPVTLGDLHPDGRRLLASTAGHGEGVCNVQGPLSSQSLLSMSGVPGGLRLVTGPQAHSAGPPSEGRQALEYARTQWQRVMTSGPSQGLTLLTALAQYNEIVPAELQLQFSPDLPGEMAHATLQPGTYSSQQTLIWFDYSLLATSGGLDEQISDPTARSLLLRSRSHAQLDVATELAWLRRRTCVSPRDLRPLLVQGCMVQNWLEALELPWRSKATFRFDLPVSAVMEQLTTTEQSVVKAVTETLLASEAYAAVAKLDQLSIRKDPPPPPRLDASPMRPVHYLLDQSGAPMGCLLLTQWAEDRAVTTVSSRRRPYQQASMENFSQLLKQRIQPSWVSRLPLNPPQEPGTDEGSWWAVPLLAPAGTSPASAASQDTMINDLLQEIRQPGHWTGFSAELAPRLLVDCPGWPVGRSLDIVNADTGTLLSRAGRPVAGAAPVTVARLAEAQHYVAVVQEALIEVPADGDCFYVAVLASLSAKERESLLRASGCAPHERQSLAPAVAALRQHFANHLSDHRDHYRDQILRLHALLQ